ncbi:hypothetical protein V8J82_12615 [Gymnodinialimonas sp. 2305UL16-5]|uniref:hypothetical protein n=1 Tax=Gymnodinialimonas mytili TaxID=3126503 RepID=UPI0030AC0BAB
MSTSDGDRSKDAIAIYQGLLDLMGRAITHRDFDAYSAYVALPHYIETEGSALMIETRDQLSAVFNDICDRLARIDIDGLTRHCLSATFTAPDQITGTHITWQVTRSNAIQESYKVHSVLTRGAGIWQVASGTYTGDTDTLPCSMSRSLREVGARPVPTRQHPCTGQPGPSSGPKASDR